MEPLDAYNKMGKKNEKLISIGEIDIELPWRQFMCQNGWNGKEQCVEEEINAFAIGEHGIFIRFFGDRLAPHRFNIENNKSFGCLPFTLRHWG